MHGYLFTMCTSVQKIAVDGTVGSKAQHFKILIDSAKWSSKNIPSSTPPELWECRQPSPAVHISDLFILCQSDRKTHCNVVFNWHFLISDDKHLFICFLAVCSLGYQIRSHFSVHIFMCECAPAFCALIHPGHGVDTPELQLFGDWESQDPQRDGSKG